MHFDSLMGNLEVVIKAENSLKQTPLIILILSQENPKKEIMVEKHLLPGSSIDQHFKSRRCAKKKLVVLTRHSVAVRTLFFIAVVRHIVFYKRAQCYCAEFLFDGVLYKNVIFDSSFGKYHSVA